MKQIELPDYFRETLINPLNPPLMGEVCIGGHPHNPRQEESCTSFSDNLFEAGGIPPSRQTEITTYSSGFSRNFFIIGSLAGLLKAGATCKMEKVMLSQT